LKITNVSRLVENLPRGEEQALEESEENDTEPLMKKKINI
jgi:hypothetical protein